VRSEFAVGNHWRVDRPRIGAPGVTSRQRKAKDCHHKCLSQFAEPQEYTTSAGGLQVEHEPFEILI
jgi:hypothetical protein